MLDNLEIVDPSVLPSTLRDAPSTPSGHSPAARTLHPTDRGSTERHERASPALSPLNRKSSRLAASPAIARGADPDGPQPPADALDMRATSQAAPDASSLHRVTLGKAMSKSSPSRSDATYACTASSHHVHGGETSHELPRATPPRRSLAEDLSLARKSQSAALLPGSTETEEPLGMGAALDALAHGLAESGSGWSIVHSGSTTTIESGRLIVPPRDVTATPLHASKVASESGGRGIHDADSTPVLGASPLKRNTYVDGGFLSSPSSSVAAFLHKRSSKLQAPNPLPSIVPPERGAEHEASDVAAYRRTPSGLVYDGIGATTRISSESQAPSSLSRRSSCSRPMSIQEHAQSPHPSTTSRISLWTEEAADRESDLFAVDLSEEEF